MGEIRIFDAELHLMNKIWDEGSIKAIDLANWATEKLGWKKCSTYSMLRKLLEKQAVKRDEPGFVLTPLVTREDIAIDETNMLIEKMFKGNRKLFLLTFMSGNDLDAAELEALRKLIDKSEE